MCSYKMYKLEPEQVGSSLATEIDPILRASLELERKLELQFSIH